MSSYHEYAVEKEKVDFYQLSGYRITNVIESLDGAYVEFTLQENSEHKQSLVVSTADGRKYLSSLVFEQQKEQLPIVKSE